MATIFVVEDERPAAADALSMRLRDAGHHVLSLPSVDEVIDAMRCVRVNLLVVDVRRPRAQNGPLLPRVASGGAGPCDGLPLLAVGAGIVGYRYLGAAAESAALGDAAIGWSGHAWSGHALVDAVRACLDPIAVASI